MAEAVVSSLCTKLLTAIDSPAFGRVNSVQGAETELKKLQEAIEKVKDLSVDAEMNHESSSSVRNWFKEVADMLYEAEDLVDEVIASDEKKGNKLRKMLQENSIGPPCSTKDKIKSIRERLGCIRDCEVDTHGRTTPAREDVDNVVIGSVDDKENVVEALTNESVEEDRISVTALHEIGGIDKTTLAWEDLDNVIVGIAGDKEEVLRLLTYDSIEEEKISVIALRGIGGIGKTTLAREVWKDKRVIDVFEGRRWWASISDVFGEKEITEKIFKSMTTGEADHALTFTQLQSEIRGRIVNAENFLLVLDDVCDENHATWLKIMRSLGLGAKMSRIMVTTRSELVVRAMGAKKHYELPGLSKRDSWDLFKKLVPSAQEKCPIRTSLGRQIVKNCSGVPLVIKTIASLLRVRTSLEEWKTFKRYDLFRMNSSADLTTFALKLSYYELSPNLKRCFAYCSLFPKGFSINKDKLIHLWIAQGYAESIEDGHVCFMKLVQKCFLYVTKEEYEDGEIVACGMHESLHDLARVMAGEESVMLSTKEAEQSDKTARHISLDERIDSSWEIPPSFLYGKRLRSSLFTGGGSVSSKVVDQQLFRCEFLRALTLQRMNIKEIPSSIDKLKHLKYLDFSENRFKLLPNSITSLFNLLALDVSGCRKLQSLPDNLKKLINLSYLNTKECDSLKHMPLEFEELASLQHLTCFKVGKPAAGGKGSTHVALAKLKLKGALEIEFYDDESVTDKEDVFPLLSGLKVLCLRNHPLNALAFPPNLVKLELHSCKQVRDLQHLGALSKLKSLVVCLMPNLEYIHTNQGSPAREASSLPFAPRLKRLELSNLQKLQRWSRKDNLASDQEVEPPFPELSFLKIEKCEQLVSMPTSAKLETLEVDSVKQEVVKPLLSSRSSPLPLEKIILVDCFGLESFSGGDLASLRILELTECSELKKLSLPSGLEELTIESCRQLKLWEEQSRGFNWESLQNLRLLRVAEIPDASRLPSCLKKLQARGRLQRIGLSKW